MELLLPVLSREIFFGTSCLLSCQSISFCKRRFSAIFVKRDNFCDVLFAYMCFYCLLLKEIFLTFLAKETNFMTSCWLSCTPVSYCKGRLSAILIKGDNVFNFLFAFIYTSLLLEREIVCLFFVKRKKRMTFCFPKCTPIPLLKSFFLH